MFHNKTIKGGIILSLGLMLLLHTLGIIQQSLSGVIIVGSLLLIIYGFIELDGAHYVRKFLGRVHVK